MTYKDRYYMEKKELSWDDDYWILWDKERPGFMINVGTYEKIWALKLTREGYQETGEGNGKQ